MQLLQSCQFSGDTGYLSGLFFNSLFEIIIILGKLYGLVFKRLYFICKLVKLITNIFIFCCKTLIAFQ